MSKSTSPKASKQAPLDPEKAVPIFSKAIHEEIAKQQIDITTLDIPLDDEVLVKFLKARQYNLENSKLMLINSIKWRLVRQPTKVTTNDVLGVLKLDYVFFPWIR